MLKEVVKVCSFCKKVSFPYDQRFKTLASSNKLHEKLGLPYKRARHFLREIFLIHLTISFSVDNNFTAQFYSDFHYLKGKLNMSPFHSLYK